tara:strand:+ start:550 stop:849 length:300 start_codon:yes stop_codon:yes gene_type:complete
VDQVKAEVPTQWGNEKRGWHLDKTVSISHLLTTLLIVISAITWAMGVDKRISQTEITVKYLSGRQSESSQKVEDLRKEIKYDLRDISKKLDRLIEKQMK